MTGQRKIKKKKNTWMAKAARKGRKVFSVSSKCLAIFLACHVGHSAGWCIVFFFFFGPLFPPWPTSVQHCIFSSCRSCWMGSITGFPWCHALSHMLQPPAAAVTPAIEKHMAYCNYKKPWLVLHHFYKASCLCQGWKRPSCVFGVITGNVVDFQG